jgi:hypothetical protein
VAREIDLNARALGAPAGGGARLMSAIARAARPAGPGEFASAAGRGC